MLSDVGVLWILFMFVEFFVSGIVVVKCEFFVEFRLLLLFDVVIYVDVGDVVLILGGGMFGVFNKCVKFVEKLCVDKLCECGLCN